MYIKKRFSWLIIVVAMLAALFGVVYFTSQTNESLALYNQDDNIGQWSLSFQNSVGILNNNGLTIDGVKGVATVAAGESGSLLTSTIRPTSFYNWKTIDVLGTWSHDDDVKIQLYSCDAVPRLLPEGVLPITGRGNNQTGYSLRGGSLDISGINSKENPCLQVKILLSSNPNRPSPVIRRVNVNWVPKTVFLISTKAAQSVDAGDNITYTIDYSISYVNDRDIVIYMPLPIADAATYDAKYRQDLGLSFKSATQEGSFTSKSIKVDGIDIPANSVYWKIGTKSAGTTGSLSAVFGTKNGTENGVVYATKSTIVSLNTSAVTSDNNTSTEGSQPVKTVIKSSPGPRLSKNATGISLNNVTHVYSGAPHNNKTTYSMVARNDGSTRGVETIFNPIITDDLTEIFTTLMTSCSVTNPSSRISAISNGGILDSENKRIVWKLNDLAPLDQEVVTFDVDYSGCAGGLKINNKSSLKSDKGSEKIAEVRVIMGVDANPSALYSKTERTRTGQRETYAGDTTTYILSTSNTGAVRLDNTVMMDRVPDGTMFVSANLTPNSKGKIFYYTKDDHQNASIKPNFDYSNLNNPGDGWTDKIPEKASSVKWVAFFVPCLSPAGIATSGSCANMPSSVQGEVTVKVDRPADICREYEIKNKGIFDTYSSVKDVARQNDKDVELLQKPISGESEVSSRIIPNIASFRGSSSLTGKTEIKPVQVGDYSFVFTNNGTANAKNATIEVPIPKVDIGGNPTQVDFVNLNGGEYIKETDPSTGKISKLIIKVGDIPVRSSRNFTLSLSVPKGVRHGSVLTVNAILRASDPNNCAPINHLLSTTTTIKGVPQLQIVKSRNESLIKSASDIHYQMKFSSIGDTPTTDTFVVDRVPDKTVFKQAYTKNKDDNSNQFDCRNCKVYFASKSTKLPANISTTEPLTPDIIYTKFSLGRETSPGVWLPPVSIQPSDVSYVAYKVDDSSIPVPQLNSGESGVVGMVVTNKDGANGSSPGTIITNYPGIISNETLQAIGNTVGTTVLEDPGLVINKSTTTPIVSAGSDFDWIITYHNDSETSDSSVLITDTLPYGVKLKNIYHKWNDTTVNKGAQSGEVDITNNMNTDTVVNPDGTTTIKINIARGLRGGDLHKQEGGSIRLKVQASDGLASGAAVTNTVRGCYQNMTAGPYCLTSDSTVYVENADLWLRKQVNNSNPLSGQSLIYSLVIANKGKNTAKDVKITDTLPKGLCYEGINIITPGDWKLGQPSVSGGPCETHPTTLTWEGDNSLYKLGLAKGTIPGESDDITIQYRVRVHTAVSPGAALTNGAKITTTTKEDDVYPNGDSKIVTTPLPDPYVNKEVSGPSVLPGASFDYYIRYGNDSLEAAQGALIIDGMPDYDGDGRTDITILSVLPQNNERIYYYDENNAPKLTTLGLSAAYNFDNNSNFKKSLNDFRSGTYPTHIIIVPSNNGSLPSLDGPRTVMVKSQMTNPYTGISTPAGTTIINHVTITSSTRDANDKNNNSNSTTHTPNADLAVTKTASPEGSYPGVSPGGKITYKIDFANKGSALVCGVHITESYPPKLINISQRFNTLSLTNTAGLPVLPVDEKGVPISGAVNINYDERAKRWYIGGADYQKVCLPAGSKGQFKITGTVADDAPDKAVLENIVTIGEDSPATEDTLENNTSKVGTTVYRADLRIKKEGVSAGPDGVFGTSDDNATTANAKEKIRYKLSYNNSGNIDAANTEIKEIIPEGTCFTAGSLDNVPHGSRVEYSNDGGTTYTYIPSGDKDCNVTNLRVVLGVLPAPANIAAGSSTQLGDKKEFMGEVRDIISANGSENYYENKYIIKNDNTLWAWGDNKKGSLGVGLTTYPHGSYVSRHEFPVKAADDVKSVSYVPGSDTVYVIKNNNTLWVAGYNSDGQVGDGTTEDRPSLTKVLDDVRYVTNSNGGAAYNKTKATSYAIKTDNTLWAWGYNNDGQVGNGTRDKQTVPIKILDNVEKVVAKGDHTFAITSDNTLWAWGDNQRRHISKDLGEYITKPTRIMTDVKGVYKISTGYYGVTLVIKTDNTLWAWGNNDDGQIGNGTTTRQTSPVKVLDNVKHIAYEDRYYKVAVYAIKNDNTLWAWGNNDYGQIGNGTTTRQTSPVKVLDDVKYVDTRSDLTRVIKTDNTLWAWGSNSNGQIGNGTTTRQTSPVKVLDNVKSLIGDRYGGSSSFVIKTDNTLWAWGSNSNGQIGNGTTTRQTSPVKVLDDVKKISSTGYWNTTMFALKSDGSVYGWGNNHNRGMAIEDTTEQSVLYPTNLKGTGHIAYQPATGTTTIPLHAPSDILAWKGLYITTDPARLEGGSISYHLMEQNCTTPVTGMQNLNPINSPIDISSLPSTKRSYCLRVDYKDVSQTIVTARMSYSSTVDPFISFDVITKDQLQRASINNTATVSTDTPETNYNNNTTNYNLRIPQADLELDKSIDQSVISTNDVNNSRQLTYKIKVKNNGPNDATKPVIVDTLPAGLVYVDAKQESGNSKFIIDVSGQKITFSSNDNLAVGQSVTLIVKAVVNTNAGTNQQFINDACVSSRVADSVTDNNCDSATVTIGQFANVYIKKTGPLKANIAKEITYKLYYGNNGNIPATGWKVSDPLDKNVEFVSAEQKDGPTAVDCRLEVNTITCASQNNATLPIGETGIIEVKVRIKDDQSLSDNKVAIINRACISTDSTQVSISDDCDRVVTTVWPGDLAGFGGRVFLDFNKDVSYQSGIDKALSDVTIYASGYDTTGKIYGPAANDPHYGSVMKRLLPILKDKRLVPDDTTIVSLASLSGYVSISPTKTTSDGTYSFNGLKPGVYFATEIQPIPYASIGSTGGYLGIDQNTGLPIVSTKDGSGSKQDSAINDDHINTIRLGEGDFSQGNDFGELPGSIGNYIWKDLNNNGKVDNGEQPISGVEVTLYRDNNNDNVYSSGIDTVMSITKTNNNGHYSFNNIPVDDGSGSAKYIVVVTDKDRILSGYLNSRGDVGRDDNSQDPKGYAVELSLVNPSDMTADFGYYRPIDLEIIKEVDGNADGVFSKEEKISLDREFAYRIVVGNSSLDLASGVKVEDHLPRGLRLISTQTSQGAVTENNGIVTWSIGEIAPTARPTLILRVKVDSKEYNKYKQGLDRNAKSVNVSRISAIDQSDDNPDNNSSLANTLVVERVMAGDTIWNDRNRNGVMDSGEHGIPGVNVVLFKDDGDRVFNINKDIQINSTVTDAQGRYNFADLEPAGYFVVITQSSNSSQLSGYRLTKLISKDANDKRDNVNDGVIYAGYDIITTSQPVDLVYGSEPAGNGSFNNTIDFGFYKDEQDDPHDSPLDTPQSPRSNNSSQSTRLAITGDNMLAIILASTLILLSGISLANYKKRIMKEK